MRTLNKRVRPDNMTNEIRVQRGTLGRYIYLAFLAVFALGVLNYLFGDVLILRGDGLVLKDENVVATTYIARVVRVDVQQGQLVEKGRPLLQLQSLEILERLADLSTKRAELVAKATDFKIRSQNVTALLPLAERRETESGRVIKQFESMAKDGFVRSVPYAEALSANYSASRDRVTLSSEGQVLGAEMSAFDHALADADAALRDLKQHYGDGVVTAPVSGSVGAVVPFLGNVYRPGEPLMSIYSGDPYVLLYLPRRYLFPIDIGLRVSVTDGQRTTMGTVVEILPVTATLPREFQNTFQPTDRNQLAKIKLSANAPFPLNQKVRVTRPYFWERES